MVRYAELRARVWEANRELARSGLVVLSFGNVSGVDRQAGVMAIKPSGADYAALRPEEIVVVGLDDGRTLDGAGRPSSDTPTHLVLYRSFAGIGGVVHTHSIHATSWAQAEREIPCLGTTHADHFRGPVPVTRPLTDEEIRSDYELATGKVIVERFARDGLDPDEVPGCLDARHGPFTWGESPESALANAIVLEQIAAMALHTLALGPTHGPIPRGLLDKHFARKHGATAYYGQPRTDQTGRP